MLKKLINGGLNPLGYTFDKRSPLIGRDGVPRDIQDDDFLRLFAQCKPASACGLEPMYALYKAVEYIVRRDLEGDLVECGVFRGGSAMMMALGLRHFGCRRGRRIYLYDTYEGMPPPTDADRDITGNTAASLLADRSIKTNPYGCYSPIEEVQANLRSTGYDEEKLIFVKGMVEDTIPGLAPESIALLRLDTDWHASTRHELIHLYPRLQPGGVMMIDDYGHWQGARKAVDEYLAGLDVPLLLQRVDYTVRSAIKPG